MSQEVKESSPKDNYGLRSYSYADYLTWPEDTPVELIEGIPYTMTTPMRIHQEVVGEVLRQIANYLVDKPCKVYVAPFDVRLADVKAKADAITNVVQPDIAIICDKEKLDDKGCLGSPDLIAEVVSPSSAAKDYIEKLNLYEKYSVREYWIIHPMDKIAMVYQLEQTGKFSRSTIYSFEETIPVGIFEDLTISLAKISQELSAEQYIP
ncbi:Uma2 family endonuclease [Desulfitobacterium chlororespirans]|uniref:Endonuclease, Uma2 family (Restriction endonuclease fold) n=1 Tax=Desulfitobacterium chlororespirans DSM 11544 TaxID=1121395 RepID=A0A1M7UD65_9FIRM|nr:Uma2 family endonuclease [Desulfitobacterium chlororespirans]SHN80898.1 Endonuclease, Uma2 family (restriction endonuclease fold) [Desulfitobacterium chlororespirans DSM 11544]